MIPKVGLLMFQLFLQHVQPSDIRDLAFHELRMYGGFCDVMSQANKDLAKKAGLL